MSSFFWRCVGFGCLWALWQVCSSIYVLDAWPLPFTWLKIASAGGVAFVGGCFTYARDPESAFGRSPVMTKMIIIFVLLSALLGLSGCTTSQPTLFSGKPVIQIDQGQAFLTYIKISRQYAVFKYQVTQWCGAKTIPAETCESLADTDKLAQAAANEIEQSLANPTYPLDMNKVQTFIDLAFATMVRAGVKGISGGIIP